MAISRNAYFLVTFLPDFPEYAPAVSSGVHTHPALSAYGITK